MHVFINVLAFIGESLLIGVALYLSFFVIEMIAYCAGRGWKRGAGSRIIYNDLHFTLTTTDKKKTTTKAAPKKKASK